MNKKVFVNSRDEYLILRLQVLCERQGLSLCESADEDGVTLVVYDMDLPLAEQAYDGVRCLTVSRAEQTPADIHLPVLNAELTQLLREDRQGARLRIRAQEKSAYLDGRRIRLTEIEASLLSLLAEALVTGAPLAEDEMLSKHAAWAEELKTRHVFTRENAMEILKAEVGAVFVGVLEDAGVYKCTPEGRAAMLRFVDAVNA